MNDDPTQTEMGANKSEGIGLINKLIDTARTEAAYGNPMRIAGQTIFTVSEVNAIMGFCICSGSGCFKRENLSTEEKSPAIGEPQCMDGHGMGGGGTSFSRPVAVISINPDGVTVTPVFDKTKVAIAMFTALGTMAVMLGRILGGTRE
jgi:uncharacterized spore protein YtfJ